MKPIFSTPTWPCIKSARCCSCTRLSCLVWQCPAPQILGLSSGGERYSEVLAWVCVSVFCERCMSSDYSVCCLTSWEGNVGRMMLIVSRKDCRVSLLRCMTFSPPLFLPLGFLCPSTVRTLVWTCWVRMNFHTHDWYYRCIIFPSILLCIYIDLWHCSVEVDVAIGYRLEVLAEWAR